LHRWTLGWGNLVQALQALRHDMTTTKPDPCSESVPPEGVRGTEAPQAFRCGDNMGRVGFDARSFFPWDGRSPVSHPTCDVPVPPKRTGRYWKGTISARPSYQGVRRSVWAPETFATGRRHVPQGAPSPSTARVLPYEPLSGERLGDWDGPLEVSAPLCPPRRTTWPTGEWRWSPSAQRRCDPTGRCAYRPSVTP
jgi:hypothetical protein